MGVADPSLGPSERILGFSTTPRSLQLDPVWSEPWTVEGLGYCMMIMGNDRTHEAVRHLIASILGSSKPNALRSAVAVT